MNKLIKNIFFAVVATVFILISCDNDNEFYEVGAQPVYLTYPKIDTTWILDYEIPDTLYRFAWTSKRNFIDYNMIFSLSEDMLENRQEIHTGIKTEFYYSTMQVDSILSAMGVGIGKSAIVYWTVDLVDPGVGWSEEVRKLSITRCNLPTNVILLGSPGVKDEVTLDKQQPEKEITFSWTCETVVEDFTLHLSFSEEFEEPVSINCGVEKSYAFTHEYLDKMLEEQGIDRNGSTKLYWKVTGTGNLNNPIENSAVRETVIHRFAKDPVEISLEEPANGSEIFLEVLQAGEPIEFKWNSDTTGITYKLKLFDTELKASEIFSAEENTNYIFTQQELDQVLEQTFEMVPSQRKKIYWEVIPSDETFAISKDTSELIIRRFAASGTAPAITLTNTPADGTSFVLSYAQSDQEAVNMSWDCSAVGVNYAIEYSLDAEMNNSKVRQLSKEKNFSFTHKLLDDMMTDLGIDYLIDKKLYWRISSIPNIVTEPSETHYMLLTGMVKPLVDKRDPKNIETYKVVKIGDDFWLAENLRATIYSDGTAFTSVDLPSKSYGATLISDKKLVGQYYTWATALRDWQIATTADHTIIQGVCPDGWHVSTKADWNKLSAELSPNAASKVKLPQYWTNLTGITNSSGMGIVPGGFFWHGNVGESDMLHAEGSNAETFYWTTSINDGRTAYASIVGAGNDIVSWYYDCRPWSEGDATASRVYNIRCVRTME